MNHEKIVNELLEILENQNVEIRRDNFDGSGGGLCKLKDKILFFYDTQSSFYESALKLKEAVINTCEIEQMYLKPFVREFLEKET